MKLNREAWQPCSECDKPKGRNCLNCVHSLTTITNEPCASCFGHNHWEPEDDQRYCPCCGRPLSKRAWDKLETRIETLQKGATK